MTKKNQFQALRFQPGMERLGNSLPISGMSFSMDPFNSFYLLPALTLDIFHTSIDS